MKKFLLFLALVAGIGFGASAQGSIEDEVRGDTVYIGRMPRFQDKDLNAFSGWVASRVEYPKFAAENRLYGMVWVRFIVAADGSLTRIEALGNADKSLKDEAVRVVKMSPRWEPGSQEVRLKDGTVLMPPVPVAVRIEMPVQFALNQMQAAELARQPYQRSYMGPVFSYDDVRHKPTFQGGDPLKFAEWLAANVQLPKKALKNGEFTAGVLFTVVPGGSMEDVQVLNVTDKTTRAAIAKAMEDAPRWVSGGAGPKNPTAVNIFLPVTFR